MKLPDACRRLGLPYHRVYALMLSGQLPGRRDLAGRWTLDAAAVERLARERAEAERSDQKAPA